MSEIKTDKKVESIENGEVTVRVCGSSVTIIKRETGEMVSMYFGTNSRPIRTWVKKGGKRFSIITYRT